MTYCWVLILNWPWSHEIFFIWKYLEIGTILLLLIMCILFWDNSHVRHITRKNCSIANFSVILLQQSIHRSHLFSEFFVSLFPSRRQAGCDVIYGRESDPFQPFHSYVATGSLSLSNHSQFQTDWTIQSRIFFFLLWSNLMNNNSNNKKLTRQHLWNQLRDHLNVRIMLFWIIIVITNII